MPLCRSRKTPSSADRRRRHTMPRLIGVAISAIVVSIAVPAAQPAAANLSTQISNLSSLDYSTRMNAARVIRRLPAADAVPALTAAVRTHRDEFVRYRAFIVLSYTHLRAHETPEHLVC